MSESQTNGLKLVMWMNQPSPHQDHLAAELLHHGVDLVVVYASRLRREREETGWEVDAENAPNTIFLFTRFSFRQALSLVLRYRRAVHIVNGIWAEPVFFVVLAFCCFLRIPCCIYSEAPASMVVSTWRSRLKRPVQRLIVRMFANRVVGLLAVSGLAQQAYASLGFPQSKIYRFGYFERISPRKSGAGGFLARCTEIVYVGRLVKGKGIELLIEAAATLLIADSQLRLRIVGGGSLEPGLRRIVQTSGLQEQVVFSGVVPSRSVPGVLAGASMLVLPSQIDGWGIVVNQALQAGTPVIVSDSCGASELVSNGVNGYVFRTDDAQNLYEYMRAILDNPDRQAMRNMALETGRAASAQCAAPYLLHCLEHMTGLRLDRPIPKWIFNRDPQSAQCAQSDSERELRFVH